MKLINTLIIASLFLVFLASCTTNGPNPYKEYIEKNPGWVKAEKIEYGMDADEALASASAPVGKRVTHKNRVKEVYDYIDNRWVATDLPIDGSYGTKNLRLILTKQRCMSPFTNVVVQNVSYYLIKDSKLIGFNHSNYGKGCRVYQSRYTDSAPEYMYLVDRLAKKLFD